jgi:hypothetical protein
MVASYSEYRSSFFGLVVALELKVKAWLRKDLVACQP